MRGRKAQSSVEYLGTYAWAFLGLIVTVGALNYFGVLNPSSYTPERCESGSQIACVDTYLAANKNTGQNTILIMLTNNYPREIVIENITITNLEAPVGTALADAIRVAPGRLVTMSITTTQGTFIEGQKEQLIFTIKYHRYGGSNTISHAITGDAIISIQDGNDAESYCGDGIRDDTLGEECDPPTMKESSTISSPQCPGAGYCRSDCTCSTIP